MKSTYLIHRSTTYRLADGVCDTSHDFNATSRMCQTMS